MKSSIIAFITLLLVFGLVQLSPAATITGGLTDRLETAAADELIPINIAMVAQNDWNSLISRATKMDKEQRRAFAIQLLKDFAAGSQREVLEFLREKIDSGQVRDIRSLWSANVVSCLATPEVIGKVAGLAPVRSVDWDQKIYMLPERPEEQHGEELPA
ncbi:hypothetical protein KAX22_06575, partial [bacterium]|nr:hypothetical protein [bacterium]